MSTNSEYMDGIPTTPNTVTDSWQPAVAQIDTTKKGFNAVSLGNWDATTTKPTVLAGSEIEAAGGLVQVVTVETISDDPAGVSSGTLYLVVDFSGSDPEWYFTNDAPVWNPLLNGFYEAASGAVTWRYTGSLCAWDGASAFTDKRQFVNNTSGGSGLTLGSVIGSDGSYTATTTGDIYVIPAGAYTFSDTTSGAPVLEAYINGAWESRYNALGVSFMISDGINYRLNYTAAVGYPYTIYWHKFW